MAPFPCMVYALYKYHTPAKSHAPKITSWAPGRAWRRKKRQAKGSDMASPTSWVSNDPFAPPHPQRQPPLRQACRKWLTLIDVDYVVSRANQLIFATRKFLLNLSLIATMCATGCLVASCSVGQRGFVGVGGGVEGGFCCSISWSLWMERLILGVGTWELSADNWQSRVTLSMCAFLETFDERMVWLTISYIGVFI